MPIKKSGSLYPILILVGVFIILLLFKTVGCQNTWRLWQVPTADVAFLDIHVITGGAESYAAGYDPTINNIKDIHSGRIFNYPRIWYLLLAGHITNADAVPLGMSMIAIFILAIILFPGKPDRLTAILLTLAVFSPAVLLGVERANVDLLFFALLTFALLLTNFNLWASAILIIISAIFKLFPIFGIAGLLKETRASLRPILASGATFALYMFLTIKDTRVIFGGTAKGDFASYGVTVIANKIVNTTGWNAQTINMLFYILALALLSASITLGIRQHQAALAETQTIRTFRMGAAIYTATFLIGNNWDYRLVFLLLALPQTIEWARQPGRLNFPAKIAVATIYFSLWHFMIYHAAQTIPGAARLVYLMDEAINWGAFAILAYLLTTTLPTWVLALGAAFIPRALLPARKTA